MKYDLIIAIIVAAVIFLMMTIGIVILGTSNTRNKVEDIFRKELYKKQLAESLYAFVGWPDCQHFMPRPGFQLKAVLVNPFEDTNLDSSYMVPLTLFEKGEETGQLYTRKGVNDIPEGTDTKECYFDYEGHAFIPYREK